MRIGGGIPGTSHSVLVPGATTPTRWTWDADGQAVIDDAASAYLLENKGRAPFVILDDSAPPDRVPETPGDAAAPDVAADDLRPLGQYTFEATEDAPRAEETVPEPDNAVDASVTPAPQAQSKPKRKR